MTTSITAPRGGVVPVARAHAALVRHGVLTASGCLLWSGRTDRNGYGRARFFHDQEIQAHRLAYMTWRGPLSPDLTIDHLCCVTACINPFHMEEVTREENSRRSAAYKRLATHCKFQQRKRQGP